MEERNIVAVFYPETEWQGDLIVQELKGAGIEAYLANRSSANLWSGIMSVDRMEILVPEEKAEEARTVIDQFLSRPAEPLPEDDSEPRQEQDSPDETEPTA
jgi:hypothetical protein